MFEFDWDDANLGHIALHDVSPREAEETLQGLLFEIDVIEVDGEERVEEIGSTRAGRILKIVTVVRSGKIRVVTAYDATRNERLAFLEFERGLHE